MKQKFSPSPPPPSPSIAYKPPPPPPSGKSRTLALAQSSSILLGPLFFVLDALHFYHQPLLSILICIVLRYVTPAACFSSVGLFLFDPLIRASRGSFSFAAERFIILAELKFGFKFEFYYYSFNNFRFSV